MASSDTAGGGGGGGGGGVPHRILHEGRGQGQPASPGSSSLLFYFSLLHAREPEQGAALVSVGCPVMKVRAHSGGQCFTERNVG